MLNLYYRYCTLQYFPIVSENFVASKIPATWSDSTNVQIRSIYVIIRSVLSEFYQSFLEFISPFGLGQFVDNTQNCLISL